MFVGISMEPHVVLSSENRPDRGQIGPISLIACAQLIGVTSHFTPFTHVVLSCGNRPNRGQMRPISLIACAQLIGVTSHFTPLPLGEGKGEGPAEDGGGASCRLELGHLFHPFLPPYCPRKRDTASAISLRKDFISKVYWDRRETTVPLYLLITYKEPLFA